MTGSPRKRSRAEIFARWLAICARIEKAAERIEADRVDELMREREGILVELEAMVVGNPLPDTMRSELLERENRLQETLKGLLTALREQLSSAKSRGTAIRKYATMDRG